MSERPLLSIRGLTVRLPGGELLLDDVALDLVPGEVVVLLGGSGAGKSTLGKVLFARSTLEQSGFTVDHGRMQWKGELGLIPQTGAVFDHLDAAGNIRIALRYASPPRPSGADEVARWLEAVDLPGRMATDRTRVDTLSGGQAQRLAVARTLAGGRQVLFLDEPSTGLDPYRVKLLGDLIRKQCSTDGTAVIVVTHDVGLAARVADRIFMINPATRTIDPVLADRWPGPRHESEDLPEWKDRVEQALMEELSQPQQEAQRQDRRPARPGKVFRGFFGPFLAMGHSLLNLLPQLIRRPLDFGHILGLVMRSAFARPLVFYSIVSTLLGFTVLYVLVRSAPGGLSATEVVRLIGGAYIVALTPPITAFLFAASSGGSINAWLGGMALTEQVDAMEALGIRKEGYLWSPVWLGLCISFLLTALLFASGLFFGGWLLCQLFHVADAARLLMGDILDPPPGRLPNLVRALWLIWIYAFGIAADVVAKASEAKTRSDDVTRGMIRSVIASTLWVVTLEIVTVWLLFSYKEGRI